MVRGGAVVSRGRGLPAWVRSCSYDGAMESQPAQVAEALTWVPLELIRPNPRQPRTVFDEDDLEELAASIASVGVLQPVVVRPVEGGFELVMGERRCRASRLAGKDAVPALVRQVPDEALLRQAVLENIQRAQLNPLEEAASYEALLADFDLTHEEVAAFVGRSRSHVTHTISLLRLPARVQARVAAGVLSAGHAKALLRVPDPSVAERLAERIVAEGLSVRSTEELITLGDLPGWEERAKRPRRQFGPPGREGDLAEVASRLGDVFDTRVTVTAGKSKGKIVVEFSDAEDMARIVGLLEARGPGSPS